MKTATHLALIASTAFALTLGLKIVSGQEKGTTESVTLGDVFRAHALGVQVGSMVPAVDENKTGTED